MNTGKLNTPVTFIFFNRPDTTMKVFNEIKKARPQKLYLVSDGARSTRQEEQEIVQKLRSQVEAGIDWQCEVYKNYADKNMGCHKRMVSGISAVFEREETTIILEDDIIPVPGFFRYCEELLKRYEKETKIMYISGNNLQHHFPIEDSYTFSQFPSIWGWATWKRAWVLYDDSKSAWDKIKTDQAVENCYGKKWAKYYSAQIERAYEGELDTWDYQWEACRMWHRGLGIIPKYNMIENIGFNREDATHTKGNSMYDFTNQDMNFPLQHPKEIQVNVEYDKNYIKNIIAREFERLTYWGKIKRRIRLLLNK